MTSINVLIADDHPLVRTGVRATLEPQADISLVGEASNAEDAYERCLALRPQVLVLDLGMPGRTPEQLIADLRTSLPDLKILVLTAHDEPERIHRILQARVSGYLLKGELGDTLIQAIRAVHSGAVWFTQAAAQQLLQPPRSGPENELTPREREVLEGIARGLDNQTIAQQLCLAEQTVRNYASTVYEKIGVRSRVEAVVWARDNHFI